MLNWNNYYSWNVYYLAHISSNFSKNLKIFWWFFLRLPILKICIFSFLLGIAIDCRIANRFIAIRSDKFNPLLVSKFEDFWHFFVNFFFRIAIIKKQKTIEIFYLQCMCKLNYSNMKIKSHNYSRNKFKTTSKQSWSNNLFGSLCFKNTVCNPNIFYCSSYL